MIFYCSHRYKRIDVLVNNAGIQPPASCVPIHELDEFYWHKILAVNLNSAFYLSKKVCLFKNC